MYHSNEPFIHYDIQPCTRTSVTATREEEFRFLIHQLSNNHQSPDNLSSAVEF